jgi:sugar phosphate permease
VLDEDVREYRQGAPPPRPHAGRLVSVAAPVLRYRWVILAVGVGAQAAVAGVRQGLPALGPTLRSQFDLTLPQVGIVFASFGLGIVLTLIAWGALADRIGERTVIAAGLAGAAAALGVAALTPSFPALVAALFVAGLFAASATGASGRAVMGWFARRERGMALGVRQMGVPLGGGLAALALPILVAAWDLRVALGALAAASLVAALAAARWMREAPAPAAGHVRVESPAPLRDRRLWRLATGSGMLVIGQSGVLGFIVLYLHDERGWSAAAAAAALATLQIGGAAARVWAGRWSDGAGERIAPLRRLGAASAGLLCAAVLLSGAPTAVVLPVLVAGGVLAMSWNGLSFTAAAEMSGRERAGTAMGVQNTVLSVFGAAAPIAVASVVSAGSYPAAWAGLALVQAGGVAVLAPLVGEERRRRAAREERLRRPAPPGPNRVREAPHADPPPAPATCQAFADARRPAGQRPPRPREEHRT